MAVAFVKNHTVASNKTAGTTLALALDTSVPAGSLIVCRMVYDNAATASKPLVSSIGRAAGETNTWATATGVNSTSTTAGAFASGAMTYILTTVSWPAASYTVTLDTSTVMKAGFFQEFLGVLATLRSTSGTNYSTTTTAASAASTGTTPVIGDLALGLIFGSNVAAAQAGDNDTTGGSWSAVAGVGSTGAGAATNNFGVGQYKILTAASHQTLNNSAVMTAGNGSIVMVLQAAPDPAITQAAYRFYDDGTETGSVARAAQDTSHAVNVTAGDVNVQLRVRLQSTSAVAIPGTDDWQLQYERNTSGTWVSAVGYNSASLTEGAATTNRLGAGTGSFVAGKLTEDGLADDVGWTANNYTELLYSITLAKATFTDADTVRFRVLRNGVTTGLTYTQTPTITVVKLTGGKMAVRSASAWVDKPVKYWTGSVWTEKPVKFWTGSVWARSVEQPTAGPVPTQVGASTSQHGPITGSFTLAYPTGLLASDVSVIVINEDSGTGATFTCPGFTQITKTTLTRGTPGALTILVGTGQSGAGSWTISGTTTNWVSAGVTTWRGATTAAVIGTFLQNSNPGGADVIIPAITAPTNSILLFIGGVDFSTFTSLTPPMTFILDRTDLDFKEYQRSHTTGGSTGTTTANPAADFDFTWGVHVALPPA